jgi:diadenosine tetraphosphate (Ap4A) HIT family hydrolase
MKMGPVFWPGFLIVKLKRHCEHMAALTPAEANLLGPLLRHSCQAVSNVLNPAKVYVCSFGDGVHHIHFWILPRPVEMRPGMHWTILNLDLRTLLTDRLGIKRWQCNQGEVADLADMLRQQYHLLRQDDFTSIAG